MTDKSYVSKLTGESSRRSFLKKGALTTAGVSLGASGAGTVAAQDGGTQDGGAQGGNQAFMFPNDIVPGAQFQVDSQIDWSPQGGGQQGGGQQGGDQQGGQNDTQNGTQGGQNDSDGGLLGGGQNQAQTYVINYNFSQSYYAFLFVPQGDDGGLLGGGDGGGGNASDGGGNASDGGDGGGLLGGGDQGTQIQQGQTYRLGPNVTGADQAPVQGTVGVTFSQAGDGGGGGGGDGGGGGGSGGDGGGGG